LRFGEHAVGEKLVCRRDLKRKLGKFNENSEYKITKIAGWTYTIKDESANTKFTLNYTLIKKHFIHSYCRTCHSFQGSSISGKMTIFDWSFHFVNRKWL
jgi:hypothetical protein